MIIPLLDREGLSLLEKISTRSVTIKEDLEPSDLLEWKFIKGNTLRVPYWLAEILVDNGVAEYSDDEIDLRQVEELLIKEEQSTRPLPLKEDVYPYIRRILRQSDPKQSKRALEDGLSLLEIRLGMLIKYLSNPNLRRILSGVEEKLAPEEKVLIRTMDSLLRYYLNVILARDRDEQSVER